MPQPKKRMSATRSGNRRSHLALNAVATATCSNCKAVIQPHTICPHCGFYRGKQVLPNKNKK